MKTEITSKGVETKQSDKNELVVDIDTFIKGVNVVAALSELGSLPEAVSGLVAKVDQLSAAVAALQAELKAVREDDKKDDEAAADLAKKVDSLAAAKVKASPAKKPD